MDIHTCMSCLKSEEDYGSKDSRYFDGTWTATKSPKTEANFILGQLPKFSHLSADSNWQGQLPVNIQVYTEVIPGYIVVVAEHRTLKWQVRYQIMSVPCRIVSYKILLMSHSRRRGADFSPSQLLYVKMVRLFWALTRWGLSSDVLPALTFLYVCREEIDLLDLRNYQTGKMHLTLLKRK